MKKLIGLMLSALSVMFVCQASEAFRKASVIPGTMCYISGYNDPAAKNYTITLAAKEIQDKLQNFRPGPEAEGAGAPDNPFQLANLFKEKLNWDDDSVAQTTVTIAYQMEGAKLKSAAVSACLELNKPVTLANVKEVIQAIIAEREKQGNTSWNAKLEDIKVAGVPALRISDPEANPENVIKLFDVVVVEEGKTLLIGSENVLAGVLARQKSGQYEALPEEITKIQKEKLGLQIVFVQSSELRALAQKGAQGQSNGNPMIAGALSMLSQQNAIAIEVAAKPEQMDIAIRFVAPTPEIAMGFKTMFLDSAVINMIKGMAPAAGIADLDLINSLHSEEEGTTASLVTAMTAKDFNNLLNRLQEQFKKQIPQGVEVDEE